MTRLDLLFRRLGELATMSKEIAAEQSQCEEAIAIERATMAALENAKTVAKKEVPNARVVTEALETSG